MPKKLYAALSEIPTKVSQLELDVNLTDYPDMTTITLYANNWVLNTQTVIVPGIVENQTAQLITINPVMDTNNTPEVGSDCEVTAIAQGLNSITFSCTTVPTVDLQYYVKWEMIDYINSETGEDVPEEIILSAEGVEF